MKHLVVDEHSQTCSDGKCQVRPEWNSHCRLNPQTEVILFNNEFIIITYNSCLQSGKSSNEFILELIKNSNTATKKKEIGKYFFSEKSYKLTEVTDIKRNMLADMKKAIIEYNYIYHDNAGKRYAIVSYHSYEDQLFNWDRLNEEYTKTIDYLNNKIHLHYLDEEVKNLFNANFIYPVNNEITIHKTIESIIKEINQLTNPTKCKQPKKQPQKNF